MKLQNTEILHPSTVKSRNLKPDLYGSRNAVYFCWLMLTNVRYADSFRNMYIIGWSSGQLFAFFFTKLNHALILLQNVDSFCEKFVSCSYGWYFTFIQGWVYIALIYLQGFTTKQMVNPWKTYVKLSAVLMGSHGLTKGSLAFLNYPAQLMFKSTKVKFFIPLVNCLS